MIRTIKGYFHLIVLAVGMLLPPLGELIMLEDSLNEGALFVFFINQFLSLIFGILFIYFFVNREPKFHFEKYFHESYCLILAILFAVTALIFIFYASRWFSSLSLFTEAYRNGAFKGTGLFTYGMLVIVPNMVMFNLVSRERISYLNMMIIALVVLIVALLGLRIYLIAFIPYLFYVVIYRSKSLYKDLLKVCVIGMLLISYKIYLDIDQSKSFADIFRGALNRMSYRFLVCDSPISNIVTLDCFIPILHYFSEYDAASFKYDYVNALPGIHANMPQISLYTGVALPLPLIIYNYLGLLGFMLTSLFVFLFHYFFLKAFEAKSMLLKIFFGISAINIFTALVEDIFWLRSLDKALYVAGFCMILRFVSRVKGISK